MASAFTNAWGTTIEYSEIGPLPDSVCEGGGQGDLIDIWWVGVDETNPNHDATIADNLIHDDQCASGNHDDAIQFEAVNTLIEGNRIWACGGQCIFEGSPNDTGTVIRNNMIEEENGCVACDDSQEVSSGSPYVFEYNTIDGSQTATVATIVRGNVFLNQGSCADHAACTFNVFPRGSSVPRTNRACTPRLADGQLWKDTNMRADYFLSPADTCARGAGDAKDFPAVDIDGLPRPLTAVDAGADEIP
jgi:hypothetical protein